MESYLFELYLTCGICITRKMTNDTTTDGSILIGLEADLVLNKYDQTNNDVLIEHLIYYKPLSYWSGVDRMATIILANDGTEEYHQAMQQEFITFFKNNTFNDNLTSLTFKQIRDYGVLVNISWYLDLLFF